MAQFEQGNTFGAGRPITNKECFYLMMLISFSPFLARIGLYYDLPDVLFGGSLLFLIIPIIPFEK